MAFGACSEQARDDENGAGMGQAAGRAGTSFGAGAAGTSSVAGSGAGGAAGQQGAAAGNRSGGASGLAGSGGTLSAGGAAAGSGVGGTDAGPGGANAAGGTGALGTAGSGGTSGKAGAGGAATAGTGAGGQAAGGQAGAEPGTGGRSISFGTLLDPQSVVRAARELAASSAEPSSPGWRATGDQRRTYHFAAAGSDEPYRLCVPNSWDGTSELPLVMFLHGAGSDENTYLDSNGKQMVTLAEQHGFLLVSPKGVAGAYGNFLRLSAPFGDQAGAAELMSQVTDASERANQLSEQDVINVLELVLHEYPIDRGAMFLAGHSMGSGGTWYIGGKYASYWTAISAMSGPFVQESVYPWEAVRGLAIFVTEGTQTPSLDASRLLRDWLTQNDFTSEYLEVNADHGGMVPLVLPDTFEFFERAR